MGLNEGEKRVLVDGECGEGSRKGIDAEAYTETKVPTRGGGVGRGEELAGGNDDQLELG